jgi:hypothetical protein
MRSEGEAGRIALGYQEVLRMGLSDSPQFTRVDPQFRHQISL